MRPLRAWNYVQQASSRLQTYLLRKSRRLGTLVDDSHPVHRLEQRLFWSIMKAEYEFLPEIPLRPSGIEEFTYPDLFPSPPEVLSETHRDKNGHAEDTDSSLGSDEARKAGERGWFFYLAEISLRRTINDTMKTLYGKGEQQWMDNIHFLVVQYMECEKQIALWHSHLPQPIQFERCGWPDNELSLYLQGRFHSWHELVLRPLVYYALYAPVAADSPQMLQVILIAQQSVCVELIVHSARCPRNGGTWLMLRKTFSGALLILATVVSGDRLVPPENWPSVIRLALRVLAKWAAESADVEWMRSILDCVFREVCRRKGM
ncbi:hypothetical protein M432DRAFT_341572 [Thermoascus aurantiacus ATCC 26904]